MRKAWICNPLVVLCKHWIHGLWYKPYGLDQDNSGIVRVQSMDQGNPGIACADSTDVQYVCYSNG